MSKRKNDDESKPAAGRPPTIRARTTNNPLALRGVDGNSAVARRYRDLMLALTADMGGPDNLNEATRILVRQAAALTVRIEEMQSAIVSGGDVNDEQLTRLSNTQGRTLQRLGLRRPPSKPRSPIAAHFAAPPVGRTTP